MFIFARFFRKFVKTLQYISCFFLEKVPVLLPKIGFLRVRLINFCRGRHQLHHYYKGFVSNGTIFQLVLDKY